MQGLTPHKRGPKYKRDPVTDENTPFEADRLYTFIVIGMADGLDLVQIADQIAG